MMSEIDAYIVLYFFIFAGIPATTALSGMSSKTTALAAIETLFPTITPPKIHAPAPISTSFQMIGA